MKKFLFALVAGCVPVLVATNVAYAQKSANPEILEPQKNVITIEKEVTPVNGRLADMGEISRKVLKDFTKSNKNVTAESWEKMKDGFSVKFISNGVNTRIYYNTKGRWSGSLKNYSEETMPLDLRDLVKRSYYDYSITYVQEVETMDSHGMPTYVIYLEGKNKFIQVRIFDGEMEVWNEMKKP